MKLKEQAVRILDIPEESKEFAAKSFTTRSGGSAVNNLGIPEVRRSDDPKYMTQNNGRAYAGEVVVMCRDTGARDADNRRIYEEAQTGEVFVYRYIPGHAASFDSGSFQKPNLA